MGDGSAGSPGDTARRGTDMAFSLDEAVFARALPGIHLAVDGRLKCVYAEIMVLLGCGEGQTRGGPDAI